MGWLSPMNTPMREWRGRKVWLIGASSGIGKETALVFARAGARVVIVNGEPTPFDLLADAVLRGPIGELLPALVATPG